MRYVRKSHFVKLPSVDLNLIYADTGFPLHRMIVREGCALHRNLARLGFGLKPSKLNDHAYVEDREGHVLIARNYRYAVSRDERLNEWLDFSILRPDSSVKETVLYSAIGRYSVPVDSGYFENLIQYGNWIPRKDLLDIAARCMSP